MVNLDQKSIKKKDFITVKTFFEKTKSTFRLRLVTSEKGFDRKIIEQNLHRPGLALAGFVDLFSFKRIQVFGNTEISYLSQLTSKKRSETLTRILKFPLPCIIITNNNEPFSELIDLANEFNVPLFITPFETTKLIYLASDFLDDQFAQKISLHGSFVDVYGVGVLFIGKSGIGKSEVALDLVERGHRLVADDVVIITKKGEGILIGSGTELIKHFMEIRGLGFIDIEKVFGVRSIRFQKRLEIIVELEVWNENTDYNRTGLDQQNKSILDVDIPYVKLPILPGKNITVISEVISLNYLLKYYGYDSAKILANKLKNQLEKKEKGNVEYFSHDFE